MQGRERSATVKRRERRRHKAAAPSTSTAHPVAPAYRRSQGRAARLRQAPQQQSGAPSLRSRLAGGGSASVGGEIPSTGDARANPASSLFNAQIPVKTLKNKDGVDLYPSLSVVCFHNTLAHVDDCTNSPFTAPAIAPVREEASGSAQMRVINRRQHCYSAVRVQGHFGRRFSVRKHYA